jgi:hypothetical protein
MMEPDKDTPTPRTEKFHDGWDSYNFPHEAIVFARTLERENAALRKALIRTVDALDDARNHRYTDARAVSEAARAALKEPQK